MDSSRCRTSLAFLREARELALKDSENFDALVHAFERIGSMEKGRLSSGLGEYEKELLNIAKTSPLGCELPRKWPHFHIDACTLFELVRNQRNAAMHQGSVARNLVRHAIEFCLILEHALTRDMKKASDYMVRDICYAEVDQPISYVRQRMLVNAFSYLPVRRADDTIEFLSDAALAKWLRPMRWELQAQVLAKTFGEVLSSSAPPALIPATILPADTPLEKLVPNLDHAPMLLHGPDREKDIVGLISAFDLI